MILDQHLSSVQQIHEKDVPIFSRAVEDQLADSRTEWIVLNDIEFLLAHGVGYSLPSGAWRLVVGMQDMNLIRNWARPYFRVRCRTASDAVMFKLAHLGANIR